MKSLRVLVQSLALVATLVSTGALAAGAPFAQDESDLKPDPAVRFGRLANGLRYAVMHNAQPKGRVSVRLVVMTGSMNETQEQRGLAHFVEHEAFNGSTHFAPGTLVKYFQRLGMSFGGDTNAFTAQDETVYQLELPESTLGSLKDAMTLVSDYARGIVFTPAVIEKERGIILSEKRSRDSVESRAMDDELSFLFPGSRLSQRAPIGLVPVIEGAQRPLLVDYYDKWYRPEDMWVIVVGDLDAQTAEQAVCSGMSEIRARGAAPVRAALDTVKSHADVTTHLHYDAEAPVTVISVLGVGPYKDEPDTAANRLKQMPRDLAVMMLNRRLGVLAKEAGSPITGGQAAVQEQSHFYRQVELTVNSEPEHWREALGVADQELRRALEQGFRSDELKEAVATVRNGVEQGMRTASTRQSAQLADGLMQSIVDNNVFTAPATDGALLLPALEKVTPEDCARALRSAWASTPNRSVYVTGNLKLANPDKELSAAYQASEAVAVVAREAPVTGAFGYTEFGPAGAVKSRRHVEDLDVWLVEFANGVRLNIKRTPYEANAVHVGVRIGGGKLTEPRNEPGLAVLASSIFLAGGLGRHDADSLARILAGHQVGVQFGVGDDALMLMGGSSTADLLLELQLITAHVVDPGYRPEALRQFRQQMDQMYLQVAHSVDGPLNTVVPRLLAGGDSRFGLPPQDVLTQRTVEQAKAWLAPQLGSGAMEIALVGDVDVEAAIAAVARTLGALPARTAKPAYTEERLVSYPAVPLHLNYTVATDTPRGLVDLEWPATDALDIGRARRLRILASILQDRLRVKLREEMGDTYSPSAGADLSVAYPGYGYLKASAVVAPASVRAVADAIRTAGADLASHGVTEDEFHRAQAPLLTGLRQSAQQNDYWSFVLSNAQEEPRQLEWARSRQADYESMTAEQLKSLAAQYFDPARASEIISVPAIKSAEPKRSGT